MRITYRIDGRVVTRKQALNAWAERDPIKHPDGHGHFEQAERQTTNGYICREAIEECGITIRHANEDQ